MLKTDSKKLETRDFISVGIFSLIYSVVAFVIGGVAQGISLFRSATAILYLSVPSWAQSSC